jgi:D-galactarolactone cycloisomerase
VPFPTLVEYDLGDNPLRDSILKIPLVPVDGRIPLPEGPGLGIELDEDALAGFEA